MTGIVVMFGVKNRIVITEKEHLGLDIGTQEKHGDIQLGDSKIDTSDWDDQGKKDYFDMKEKERRLYVSQWYENIHEGRWFLFFKEQDIISTVHRYRDNQNRYVNCICDLNERWQVAQDLLTIDGGGLGEKPGKQIEHIDKE